ncbi:glycosyltransferase [Streptomyces sp. NPDC088768]|uniref:glycosyltransferase n=1 Tax=Streptomyces sp. NPDC088768 TaxID=3365894 RepID=UPI00382676E2
MSTAQRARPAPDTAPRPDTAPPAADAPRPRVLHVITGLGVGGAEQQLRLLVPRLTADSEVVTLTHPGPLATALRADGVPVHHLGMRGNRDLSALPRLARHIRQGRYDLVHTHLYRACLYGRVAARLAGVRALVATEHSLGDTEIEGRPLTPGVRALYLAGERLGTATVAVSDTVAERLTRWGVPDTRVHVVPNGIDATAFAHDPELRTTARTALGIPEGAHVLAGAGRLVPGKRFTALVEALALLPADHHLVLAGAGPEEAALRALTTRLRLDERVHLTGEQDPHGLRALFCAADVFLSPSADEAFGLAVVEALAAGLPVLYVRCPALEDLPPESAPAERVGGSPAALAEAVRWGRATGHGRGLPTGERFPVPAAVRHYAVERSAALLDTVYRHALAQAATPAAARPPRPRAPHPTRTKANTP